MGGKSQHFNSEREMIGQGQAFKGLESEDKQGKTEQAFG